MPATIIALDRLCQLSVKLSRPIPISTGSRLMGGVDIFRVTLGLYRKPLRRDGVVEDAEVERFGYAATFGDHQRVCKISSTPEACGWVRTVSGSSSRE